MTDQTPGRRNIALDQRTRWTWAREPPHLITATMERKKFDSELLLAVLPRGRIYLYIRFVLCHPYPASTVRVRFARLARRTDADARGVENLPDGNHQDRGRAVVLDERRHD